MNNYYDKNAKAFFDSTINIDLKELYETFLLRLPKVAKILDLGCGPGRDTLHFQKKGHLVTSLDSSEELAKLAKETFNLNIEIKHFSDIDYFEEFDGIWACASLLHVPKKELPDILKKLELALKKSGTMYCSFKYGDFDGIRAERHFSDFTDEEFQKLIMTHTRLSLRKSWITLDLRPEKSGERWLNVLLWKE